MSDKQLGYYMKKRKAGTTISVACVVAFVVSIVVASLFGSFPVIKEIAMWVFYTSLACSVAMGARAMFWDYKMGNIKGMAATSAMLFLICLLGIFFMFHTFASV